MKKCQICKRDQYTTYSEEFVLDSWESVTICDQCWNGIVHVVIKLLIHQGIIDWSQITTEDDLRKEDK